MSAFQTISNWLGLSPRQAATAAPSRRSSAPYSAGGYTRRTRGWHGSNVGPTQAVQLSLETLRNRTREEVRDNPNASAAIEAYVANAVGTGIKPLSAHPSPEVRERIHSAWRRWTDRADWDCRTDFYGLQALGFRSMMEAGEVLVRLRVPRGRRPRGFSTPLQVEVIEADHLPVLDSFVTTKSDEGNTIRCGIELDPDGGRVAYHLLRQHPGELGFMQNLGRETSRVPADQLLHVFRPLRPKQLRGVPWLSSILLKLSELAKYDDAELSRKTIAASLTGFIVGVEDEDDQGGPIPMDESGASEIQPGTFTELEPGEDVRLAEAADVGGMYDKYMQIQLRQIAAGVGITYEQLTGDLTGVNYSSIRAGLLEFRRRCEQIQHSTFVFQWCRPVFDEWLRLSVLAGILDLPGYAANPEPFHDVTWVTPGWPWVDPLKDIQASVLAINNGLTSRSAEVNERGYDVEQVDRDNALDRERQKKLGLNYGEAKAPSKPGLAGGTEEEPEKEDTKK